MNRTIVILVIGVCVCALALVGLNRWRSGDAIPEPVIPRPSVTEPMSDQPRTAGEAAVAPRPAEGTTESTGATAQNTDAGQNADAGQTAQAGSNDSAASAGASNTLIESPLGPVFPPHPQAQAGQSGAGQPGAASGTTASTGTGQAATGQAGSSQAGTSQAGTGQAGTSQGAVAQAPASPAPAAPASPATPPAAPPAPIIPPLNITPQPAPEAAADPAPQAQPGDRATATARIKFSGQTAILSISSDIPFEYRTMRLSGPDRLVIDILGNWNIQAPSVPHNFVIENVRVGLAPDKARIVIDLKNNPQTHEVVRLSPMEIEAHVR